MSYDEFDAWRDEMYERLSSELYLAHKKRVVSEFTTDRLRSYYLANPQVARPAIRMLKEAKSLFSGGHFDAALVFSVSASELFLKATLLRPVIHGLVHSDVLAEAVVENTLAQTGLGRYLKLLSQLFEHLTNEKLQAVMRDSASEPLVNEITAIQALRNGIVHRGESKTQGDAERSISICQTVIMSVLMPVLKALGLEQKKEKGIQLIKQA